jgi:hypothetical protein
MVPKIKMPSTTSKLMEWRHQRFLPFLLSASFFLLLLMTLTVAGFMPKPPSGATEQVP